MLIDKFNRQIDYLRISVTDRCNLRCVYCMPAEGIKYKPHSEILSFEQMHRIVKVAVGLGIKKVRITGGEPLVRKDLPLLIGKLKNIPGLKEIALTTNGMYLSDYASSLKKAGLDRINISLDTLVAKKFQKITRGGNLEAVFKGIETSLSVGFSSLKINMVLLRDFNTDEIQDFASLTKTKPIQVRCIEYMPTGLDYLSYGYLFFSCAQAKDICSSLGELIPVDNGKSGVAKVFRINNFCGTIGFISPLSEPFCSSCNKLRLTSDGRLKSCLHSAGALNLKEALDNRAQDTDLALLIKEAVLLKPQSHNLLDRPLGFDAENFSMCQIGG